MKFKNYDYKMPPGTLEDLVFYRDPQSPLERYTNLKKVLDYSDDFEWGYGGSGPQCFSRNILYHYSGGNKKISDFFYKDFLKEVVSQLPKPGGTLSKNFILSWISSKSLDKSTP